MDLALRKVLIERQEKALTWKPRPFEIGWSNVCGCLFAESYLTLQSHQGLELQENAMHSQPHVGQRGCYSFGEYQSSLSFKVEQTHETIGSPPSGAATLVPFVFAFYAFR